MHNLYNKKAVLVHRTPREAKAKALYPSDWMREFNIKFKSSGKSI